MEKTCIFVVFYAVITDQNVTRAKKREQFVSLKKSYCKNLPSALLRV